MHPLTWAYKWYIHKSNFTYQPRQGPEQNIQLEEPVCLTVWVDKKYRTTDKKVVFITYSVPAKPTSLQEQCHRKIFAMKLSVYTPADCKPAHTQGIQLSYRWGDKHDRLVGQHAIPFTAKRGYIKIFFYILDSTVVNAWILYKTVKQAHSQWNSAAQRRHTLSWFKESVILSLCGSYTSRKHNTSVQLACPTPPIQSIKMVLIHQISPTREERQLQPHQTTQYKHAQHTDSDSSLSDTDL